MAKIDCKYNPDKDYRFFYYDPNGSGFVYFKDKSLRDECANDEIQKYLDDGWNEEVGRVVSGEITAQAAMTDVTKRDGEIDDEGNDEAGEYWDADWPYKCNYKLKPLGFVCPSTKQ